MKKEQWKKLLHENKLNEADNKLGRKAKVHIKNIADNLSALIDLLEKNEDTDAWEMLFADMPRNAPSDDVFVDAFLAWDPMAAGKAIKWYRDFAKNIK